MTDEEYKGLEASILAEGCRDALVVWGDVLVDGHNRYKICEAHGVTYQTVQKDFADRNSALLWIINNQLSRRNLPTYETVRLALRKEPIYAAIAKGNQGVRTDISPKSEKSKLIVPIDRYKEIAKDAGVGHDTVAKVRKIEAVATPEMKTQLRNQEISINQAYQQIRQEDVQACNASTIRELSHTSCRNSRYSSTAS